MEPREMMIVTVDFAARNSLTGFCLGKGRKIFPNQFKIVSGHLSKFPFNNSFS
jgi:hypothetical protein